MEDVFLLRSLSLIVGAEHLKNVILSILRSVVQNRIFKQRDFQLTSCSHNRRHNNCRKCLSFGS